MLDDIPPEREMIPTPVPPAPCCGGLNHSRADSARPPIIPTTAPPGCPGDAIPKVFGPTKFAPFAFAAFAITIASHTGTRSATSTTSLMPALIASSAASFTPAAGTNSTDTSTPWLSRVAPRSEWGLPSSPRSACRGSFDNAATASAQELNTGNPSTSAPPLPGVTPPTTLVP